MTVYRTGAMSGPRLPLLVLAGLAGGLAEVVWIGLVSTAVPAVAPGEVLRQIVASFAPSLAGADAAPALGLAIHMAFGYDGAAERIGQYLRYEAVCNTAFASYPVPMLCLCDGRQVPADAVARFRKVHPQALEQDRVVVNTDYLDPNTYLEQDDEVVLQPPDGAADIDLQLTDARSLGQLRHTIRTSDCLATLDDDYAEDVLTAINEIAENGFEHASPPVRTRGWCTDDALIIQIDDHGSLAIPSGTGYIRPHSTTVGGRGLWLARHHSDVLTTHHNPSGNSVRMRFPII